MSETRQTGQPPVVVLTPSVHRATVARLLGDARLHAYHKDGDFIVTESGAAVFSISDWVRHCPVAAELPEGDIQDTIAFLTTAFDPALPNWKPHPPSASSMNGTAATVTSEPVPIGMQSATQAVVLLVVSVDRHRSQVYAIPDTAANAGLVATLSPFHLQEIDCGDGPSVDRHTTQQLAAMAALFGKTGEEASSHGDSSYEADEATLRKFVVPNTPFLVSRVINISRPIA